VEKWAFFLRNSGNEGYCSAQQWIWPDRTTYFIPLPWPANATQLLSNSSDVVRWQDPPTPIGIQVNKDQRFSYISVGRPSGVELFGAGGTFELFYKVTGQPKPKKAPTLRTSGTPAPRPAHAHDEAEEIDLKSLSSRIADPAVKAKYEAAVKALPSMTTPRLTKAIHVDVPSTITERTHVPGTASKGIMTRAVAVPNAPKLKWNSEVFQILQTYQKDLKIEPPASPPPANAPVASVPAK